MKSPFFQQRLVFQNRSSDIRSLMSNEQPATQPKSPEKKTQRPQTKEPIRATKEAGRTSVEKSSMADLLKEKKMVAPTIRETETAGGSEGRKQLESTIQSLPTDIQEILLKTYDNLNIKGQHRQTQEDFQRNTERLVKAYSARRDRSEASEFARKISKAFAKQIKETYAQAE